MVTSGPFPTRLRDERPRGEERVVRSRVCGGSPGKTMCQTIEDDYCSVGPRDEVLRRKTINGKESESTGTSSIPFVNS